MNTFLKFIMVFCLTFTIHAQIGEYKIKTIFIEKFTLFIEYPEQCQMDNTSTPFIIGVIGKNPFGTYLQEYFSNHKIKNKVVKIQNITNLHEIDKCNILFISQSEKHQLTEILSHIKERPILTISDSKGFAEEGVHINFYLSQDKVMFEINRKAAQNSGLYVDFRLLNMAKIVNSEEDNNDK